MSDFCLERLRSWATAFPCNQLSSLVCAFDQWPRGSRVLTRAHHREQCGLGILLQKFWMCRLKCGYCYPIRPQKGKKVINGLGVTQVLSMPNGNDRPILPRLCPVFLNDPNHHRCQLVECHSREIEFKRISKTHEIENSIQLFRRALAANAETIARAHTLRSDHFPKGDHLGVNGDLYPRADWIRLVHITIKRPE